MGEQNQCMESIMEVKQIRCMEDFVKSQFVGASMRCYINRNLPVPSIYFCHNENLDRFFSVKYEASGSPFHAALEAHPVSTHPQADLEMLQLQAGDHKRVLEVKLEWMDIEDLIVWDPDESNFQWTASVRVLVRFPGGLDLYPGVDIKMFRGLGPWEVAWPLSYSDDDNVGEIFRSYLHDFRHSRLVKVDVSYQNVCPELCLQIHIRRDRDGNERYHETVMRIGGLRNSYWGTVNDDYIRLPDLVSLWSPGMEEFQIERIALRKLEGKRVVWRDPHWDREVWRASIEIHVSSANKRVTVGRFQDMYKPIGTARPCDSNICDITGIGNWPFRACFKQGLVAVHHVMNGF